MLWMLNQLEGMFTFGGSDDDNSLSPLQAPPSRCLSPGRLPSLEAKATRVSGDPGSLRGNMGQEQRDIKTKEP